MTNGHLTVGDGIRLYFETYGNGPMVLVPNGLYLVDDFKQFTARRTLVHYDVRNRGRSDTITDRSKLTAGVLNDVEDLDAVRTHFGLERLDLIAHSYVGLIAALYTRAHPDRVNRLVQIGPTQPHAAKQYASDPTDTTLSDTFAKLAELRKNPETQDPQELCRRFWLVLSAIYVTNPANSHRIHDWGRCELPNERNMMKYWMEFLQPSMQALTFTAEQFRDFNAPVLTIHGTRDRSAPYGGGCDWASLFPNARLLSIDGAGHAPWIEAPEIFYKAVDAFLAGSWPPAAEHVPVRQGYGGQVAQTP